MPSRSWWLADHRSWERSSWSAPRCEWRHLIYDEGLTIQTNLFGTTYYSLVGLHAFHVTVGLARSGDGIRLRTARICEAGTRRARGSSVDCIGTSWMWCGSWFSLVVYVIGR